MRRRAFIIATTCLSAALAAPGLAQAEFKKALRAKFVKVEDEDPLTIVKVDGSVCRPTPRDLEYWRKVFEEAQFDPPLKGGHSYWEVFEGSKSLLKVRVRDIVIADPSQSFYTINTVEFGKLLLKSVKNKGPSESSGRSAI